MDTVKSEFEMQMAAVEAVGALAVAGRDTQSEDHYKVQEGTESDNKSLIVSSVRLNCSD